MKEIFYFMYRLNKATYSVFSKATKRVGWVPDEGISLHQLKGCDKADSPNKLM